MRTDAEHRALDERLDILTWGLVIVVLSLILLLPGTHHLWYYMLPTGLIFVGMSTARKMIRTRRDTEGLIAGIVLLAGGLLNVFGVDFRFFPLIPGLLLVIGGSLLATAFLSNRTRRDPDRPAE